MKNTNNYHDFVITDGKFVGKFEEMYQKCHDPWCQDSKIFVYKYISLNLLKLLGYLKFDSILDIGCGKGRFTNAIKDAYPDAKVTGIDISETAIKEAGKLYADMFCFKRNRTFPPDE